MTTPVTKVLGVSLAGLFVLLATHGEKFLAAIGNVPAVIEQWSAPAALGAWSVLAGLLLPIGLDLALDRWIPPHRNAHGRMVLIEVATALAAVLIVFLLLPTTAGLMLGIGCGMFAPLFARCGKAIASWASRQLEVDP